MKNEWISLEPAEAKRKYIFGNNPEAILEFNNVTALYVSDSGTHYLECDEGKVIVSDGWLAVVLDVDEWTSPKHERL